MVQGLLLCATIVILCIAFGRISDKIGIPSLILFMGLGMVFGVDGIIKINFNNYDLANTFCSIALIFIMFYGGFGTNWRTARRVLRPSVLLSSLGVLFTALLTAAFCHFVLSFSMLESMLTGAVLSSTDAASVFSVLRAKRLNLKHGTASLLEVESGSNDPASYLITVAVLSLIEGAGVSEMVSVFFSQIAYGLLSGILIALLARFLMRKFDTTFVDGMDTVFIFAIAVLAYALPCAVGGNGYLSVYLAGVILGNSELKNKKALVHFFDGITNLAQMSIFFLLGLLATPSRIPSIIIPAIAIVLFLTFVSRPVAVFALLSPLRRPVNQQLLISWAGLRGASSIVFAIVAMTSGVSIGHDLFHIVFCVALFSVALQGTLLPYVARKLKMVSDDEDVLKTFNDYQDQTEMQLMKVYITWGHPYVGSRLCDLTFPFGMLIVMIRREGKYIVPHGDTVLESGDMLVLGGEEYRDHDQVQLREVQIGAEHHWIGSSIKSLGLPRSTLIIMLKKQDGTVMVPNGDTTIEANDTLIMSG